MRIMLATVLPFFFSACSDRTAHFAPVTELSFIDPIPNGGVHRVNQGESLYEVAWRYGLDFRQVALRNNIAVPYAIYPGQTLYVTSNQVQKQRADNRQVQLNGPQPIVAISSRVSDREPNFVTKKWVWPTKGVIIHPYSASFKGINIAGMLNQPIYAAAAGKVVYCGDGLKRYGQLIIIKHNNLYLSAYAHNNAAFVKEGDWVIQGQKIAVMGNSGTDRAMLHFEIRRAGRPVNPTTLLRS
ncbi:MAG: hypothetical protein A3F14_01950 [Gammaproteobacteria bacterium RIFCSPHIGHO2_12_FULL_43_28]|nr:MAG: hypothetical protein A3F14_01950 [Gammaproteobacteria bacterium RIFCSPHIGHO2_12_FULL_43_28]